MSLREKPLIIAEKPSAARAIAEALGGFVHRDGYLESPQYRLSWAIGHLVELLAPEEYEARWKRWSLDSLPMLPVAFGLKIAQKTRSQFNVIARLGRAAPALVNACDAAREGELIFRYICQTAGFDQPVQRLWVSSLTRESIRRAFSELRPESAYETLYRSALCRAQGDWLVGMNATRAFTVKWGELFSVGRVQTPTLALLVKREREIAAFVPEGYWELFVDFETGSGTRYQGKWFNQKSDRLEAASEAEMIQARVSGQSGTILSTEEKPASERPPLLYDLTTLQREANRRFGWTAAATLKAAQALYEAKLITYPRTDSRYLNRDLLPTLGATVRMAAGLPEFAQTAQKADLSLVHQGNRRVVDDSKVSDHHAIIPTGERPGGLAGVNAKLYGLIMRRFLAQFYGEARYRDTEVITGVGADSFRSRGRQVIDLGWRVVEPEPARAKGEADSERDPVTLPRLQAEEAVTVCGTEVKAKQTQPPRHYTEAGLLSAMEFAGKELDDHSLRDAMKGRGLGTPATRASIIERLKQVGYVELEKKALLPTVKGHRLIALVEAANASVLISPELTGEWERRIADIQDGTYDANRLMAEIRSLAAQVVELVRSAPKAVEVAPPALSVKTAGGSRADAARSAIAGRCPQCGGSVARSKREWACSNSDCSLRIPVWLCGKAIEQPVAERLLLQGRTKLITGFTSPRTGSTFRAYLLLRQGKVEFEFPKGKASDQSRAGLAKGRSSDGGKRSAAAKTGPRKASR